MKLHLRKEYQCGSERYYPLCETSVQAVKLFKYHGKRNRSTFMRDEVEIFKKMGCEVLVEERT